jgi:hypothetical protein
MKWLLRWLYQQLGLQPWQQACQALWLHDETVWLDRVGMSLSVADVGFLPRYR